MGRTVRNRQPYVRPVEKVEISEKHIGRRLIAAAVFLLIGAGALAYFFVNLVRGDTGWTEIKVSTSELNCGGDFTFLYEVGAGGGSALQEKRAVTAAYTEAAEKAFWMFENVRAEGSSAEEPRADGTAAAGSVQEIHGIAAAENGNKKAAAAMGSVRFLNDHPNETVTVDPPLYEALAKLEAAGGRWLYLPAVYEVYDNLFASGSDQQAEEFDPRANDDVAAYFGEVLAYANNPAAVDLELLGSGQVRLNVSQEYLAFAAENEIDSFIDFYWMKNAFIVDYLAETMSAAGFTHGSISSFDGFVRNLDGREIGYSFQVYDWAGGGQEAVGQEAAGREEAAGLAKTGGEEAAAQILPLAVLQYRGPVSLVYLRDYAMNSLDRQHYYQTAGGEIRTAYIDPQDGLCRNSVSSLVSYTYDDSAGCADILLSMIPVYIADEFDAGAVEALAGERGGKEGASAASAAADADGVAADAGAVYSIYRLGDEIHANDPAAEFTEVYEGYTIVN